MQKSKKLSNKSINIQKKSKEDWNSIHMQLLNISARL